jgi:DNA-binding NarL/FixJ family response regulator
METTPSPRKTATGAILKPRRIILVGLPRMLNDIVTKIIAEQPDLEVVADVGCASDVAHAVADHDADLVIADPSCTDGAIERLVGPRSSLRLLEVEANGSSACLSELRPHRVPLGEISPERLLEAIRT